ncbi:hypothetical protein [Frigoribacterium salinisoli]
MTDRRAASRLLAFRAAGVVDALHVSAFVLRAVLRGLDRTTDPVLARSARGDALVAVVGLALAGVAERELQRDVAVGRAPRPTVRRLLVTGLLVNTVGTVLSLAAPAGRARAGRAVGSRAGRAGRAGCARTGRAGTGYLLVGGDLVSVAYLLAARR